MKLSFHSYRFAEVVLEHKGFGSAKAELIDILSNCPIALLDPYNLDPRSGGVKFRTRKATKSSPLERRFFLPVDQKSMNAHLDQKFSDSGWISQPPVVAKDSTTGPQTGLRADFKKNRVQVEIQFGNMARWYTDVFKFQLSYSLDEIDVAALVVPMQRFANLIDENVVYFERVVRELPHAKMSLTLPILVVGIEPESFDDIRKCYEAAGDAHQANADKKGKPISPISFDERCASIDDLSD